MARKGKLPIQIPTGVEVKFNDEVIHVKGPKGSLDLAVPSDVLISVDTESVTVSMSDKTERPNFHGLYRTLIVNMVTGVSKGFQKNLEMIGVGYRAQVQGQNLNLTVGFSHPTLISIPEWAKVSIEKNTKIKIEGTDCQKVGQFAATIRGIRPPEPYQGKGIRYEGEKVRRKAGKTASKK